MRIASLVVVSLIAGLPAQRELLDELPPDGEAWDYRVVAFGPEFERVALPGVGEPKGLAWIGGHVWFARGDRLLRLSWPACAVEVDLEAPVGLQSLCAGERFLYGLGPDGLLVLDPIAGRTVRTVPLVLGDADSMTDAQRKGLVPERFAARGVPGKLLVSTAFWWFEVDAGTGTGVRLGRLLGAQWLAHDGVICWWGSQRGMNRLVTEEPAASGRFSAPRWPWALRAGAATWIEGRLLLAAERGSRGNEGVFVSGLLTPEVDAPAYRLTVDVLWVAENKRKWLIGPKPLYTLQACQQELVRLAEDPRMMVKRPDGTRGPMQVFVRSHPKVTNADVTEIWDTAAAAGFTEIRCPPIEAWVLAERRRKAAAEAARKK